MQNNNVSWKIVNQAKSKFLEGFPDDEFLKKLLDGTISVAKDKKNPVRGNQAASTLREVLGHVLSDQRVPEEKVQNCCWYVQNPEIDGPTRRQRVKYTIQAGLSDDYLNQIGFELELIDELNIKYQELNKFTHVSSHTVLSGGSKIRKMIYGVLNNLRELLMEVDYAYEKLCQDITGSVDEEVFEKLIMNTHQELDILSTHTCVDSYEIEEIKIIEIDDQNIRFGIKGQVHVNQNYGSTSEFREGDGLTLDCSYPFETTANSEVVTPGSPVEVGDINVDTDSWYS